jgi:hypothetical protein
MTERLVDHKIVSESEWIESRQGAAQEGKGVHCFYNSSWKDHFIHLPIAFYI